MRTLLWSYLGWRRFPRELSAFEVRHFFSLTRRDRQALRKRFRTRARLGAAIQLVFVRMTGTMLEALEHVPRAVFAHVAHQLALPVPELGTSRALHRRRSTFFEHQAWACAYAGLHWPEVMDVTAVVESLVADSAGTLDRHRLARAAREALLARSCLIPGDRKIQDWVPRAVALVEVADRQRLDAAVRADVCRASIWVRACLIASRTKAMVMSSPNRIGAGWGHRDHRPQGRTAFSGGSREVSNSAAERKRLERTSPHRLRPRGGGAGLLSHGT